MQKESFYIEVAIFAEMEITFKLDSKKTVQPRLYFLINEGQSELTQIIALQMRKRVCKRNYVYLQVHIIKAKYLILGTPCLRPACKT